MLTLDVLVIGAGLSGLVAASQLAKTGLSVQCVEKARGSGGRLSSKRVTSDRQDQAISFDLGCASFNASSELFRSQVESWIGQGLAKIWHYSDERGAHYVPVPRSSSITRSLADDLPVHFSTRITAIQKEHNGWLAFVGEPGQQIPFAFTKHIVFATPPQQAADLLPPAHPFKAPLSEPILLPQWVLMLYVKGHLELSEPYYEFSDSPIAKLMLEQSKPDRVEQGSHQTWVLHATTEWSAAYIDSEKEKVANFLMAELASHIGSPVIIEQYYVHRWLYSQMQANEQTQTKVSEQLHPFVGKGFLTDDQGLWFCGDYLAETDQIKGVEAAYTSGYLLARNFHG
jgi:predicted NAD/FAD-dependent oxidoreductase